ncbi:MAG: hypothetical protein ACLQVI_41505 [Polyangiaceae bacterium]
MKVDALASRGSGVEAHFDERAADELRHAVQTSRDDRRDAPSGGRAPALDRLEPQQRRGEPVAELVREDAGALRLAGGHRLVAKPRVFRDGFGDGVVEAQVERMKILRADRRRELHGQLGDGLADVAVVVNYLGHRVAAVEERGAVRRGAAVHHVEARRGLASQRVDELVQEERDAGGELPLRGSRRESLGDLRSRPRDELVAVRENELDQHCERRPPCLLLLRRVAQRNGRAFGSRRSK